MILALILFLGGLVILAWLFLWARQRQHLESSPLLEDMLADVPAASADDAVMVSREHGQLVYLNDRARRWLNLNGDEPDLEFVARLAQPADSFLELFGGEGQASFQLGTRWVEGSSHRIPAGNETRTVVVLRELGAGTASAAALDLSLAMTVINRIGEMVNASQSVEQVLQTLLSIVREAVPTDAGEVCLWDESERLLRPRGWVGEAAYVLALAEAGGVYREDEGISGWIARQRRPVLVADSADATAVQPHLSAPQSPYCSFVGVPLLLGERFMGTFELAAAAPGHFTQKDLALLQAVSKQLAIAIHNAELYAHQARYIDDIATLQQVIDQPDDADDYVRAVYASLSERLARLIGADMCGILLYNESKQALVAELPFHNVPDQIVRSYTIPVPEGSPQRAIWEKQLSWHSNDLREEPLVEVLGLTSLMTVTGMYNTLLVPMIVGERRIGVVQASNKQADGGFTLRDIQTMRMLATQAAVVAESARLYQQDQARAAELGGLQEITYAIGAFSQEAAFFAQINERIARLMGVALCGVLLYEDDDASGLGRLVARPPFYGVDDALVAHYSITLTPGGSLQAIWEDADYWYTNRALSDRVVIESGLEPLAQALDIRQTMLAVLTVGGRRLGVVQVSNRLNGQDFTDQDARLLMIFATQAAALIENARLYQAVQQRVDEAERLRRIAEMTGAILTPDDSFTPVLAEVAQLTESAIVFISVLDQHSSNIITHPHYIFGVEMAAPIVQDAYAPGFERGAAISQRSFYSNDVLADTRVLAGYRQTAERYQINSVVMVPLAVGERSIGEMGIANRTSRPYGPDDRQTLLAVAAQISAALDRVMLYESTGQNLNRRLQELDAISRVSNELTLTLDLDRVLDVIRQEAARAAGADGSSVALLRPLAERADPAAPELARRLGDGDFPPGLAPIEHEAVQRGADSVLVADYAASDLPALPPYARSAIAAAFLYADEVVGVIHLYHRQMNAFDARAADFLTTLAAKAALGYGNAVRYQEQITRSSQLRQRVEQLNQIFELGQLLHSSTDQVTMLEAIAYSIQHSVGYDVVLMLLLDEASDALRRAAQAGMPLDVFERGAAALPRARFEALCQPDYRISESYLLPAETRDQWVNSADTAALVTQFEGQREPAGSGPNAWRSGDLLLVPLTSSNGRLLGLVALDGPQNNQRPTRADIEILEIFAHHASTTIENARLYLASIASAEQEARLNEIMEAVASTLDQDGIIRSLAGGALRLVPFTRMTFALRAPDADAGRRGADGDARRRAQRAGRHGAGAQPGRWPRLPLLPGRR
jgi:GAF domain-containing protein